jgi:hypothetical protein
VDYPWLQRDLLPLKEVFPTAQTADTELVKEILVRAAEQDR